jgi:hypothetical protein
MTACKSGSRIFKSLKAYWWWTSVVWATGATAIHNLQQQRQPWPGCETIATRLSLNDDPLAYLGILVDILQEWDRYTVSRSSILSGKLPLQGKDVGLTVIAEKIRIDYRDRGRAEGVRMALDLALSSWEEIVEILPTS